MMAEDLPVGRPSSFTEEIANRICDRIVAGDSLRTVCAAEDMPAPSTVFLWLSKNKEFSEQYARAREAQADALFDEVLDIADDGTNDWMERHSKDGKSLGWALNGEAVRRSQLRVDARKWMAGKLQPKKYGERLDLNHSGSIARPLSEMTDEELAAIATGRSAGDSSKT